MTSPSSAPVSQSLPAIDLKAMDSLVASLAANAKLLAQLYEAHSPSIPSFNEIDLIPSRFRIRLFPGQHIPPDGIAPSSPNVLPMCPVCTHRTPLRCGEGGEEPLLRRRLLGVRSSTILKGGLN